ncbi:hypothetical protein MO973_19720 [Paenibacillus sp. TRM 82003]|nr:hypothetical protein [Paenibacillus sp. TRM 82003]
MAEKEIDKQIAKEITIALIEKIQLNHPTHSISADQAIEHNGEIISKLYKQIYDAVSNA